MNGRAWVAWLLRPIASMSMSVQNFGGVSNFLIDFQQWFQLSSLLFYREDLLDDAKQSSSKLQEHKNLIILGEFYIMLW